MTDVLNKAPDTIGSDECAELLRCSVEQAEELARLGEIPGLKIGRGWLFIRADLIAYLAEKARREADERRSKRQPMVTPLRPVPKARRKAPPTLPVPSSA